MSVAMFITVNLFVMNALLVVSAAASMEAAAGGVNGFGQYLSTFLPDKRGFACIGPQLQRRDAAASACVGR